MAHRVCIVALAAAVLPMEAVDAKELRYPAAHPAISLQLPDDWSVIELPLGQELQSPQNDAHVVVGLTAGDRKAVDGWSRRALARLADDGVVFAKTGGAKSVTAKTQATKTEATKTEAATPQTTRLGATGGHPYTFGGAPTVESPKIASESTPGFLAGHAGTVDLQSITTEGIDPGAMKPSGHFAYAGGSLRGQPVDVELAVFPLGKDKRLLTMQQSGPTDARGVRIVRSLRNLAPTR